MNLSGMRVHRGLPLTFDSAAKAPVFRNCEKVFRNDRFKIAYNPFLIPARVF